MALPLLAIAAIGVGVASIGTDLVHTASNWNDTSKEGRKRRSSSYYEPTSFTNGGAPELLTPLKTLKPLEQLVNIQTLAPLKTLKPISTTLPKRTVYKNAEFNELTDPLQVNSLSDVLFNQEGRDIIMEDLGLEDISKVPILGSIAETAVVGTDMLWNKFAKPTLNGEFGKAFINGLNGLGEDLDYIDLANTVKGFVLEKDKSKAFNRSLGIGHEGKYNYNYNTGNGWLDFGLETVSSPGTWITLVKSAVSSGIKSMAKTAIKESAERIAKETGADFTNEIMQSFIKRTSRAVTAGLIDNTIDSNALVKELMTDYVARSLNKNSVAFSKQFMKEFNKDMIDVTGSKLMTALKFIKPIDEINDALSAATLKTYLTGGTYPILHSTYDPIISRLKTVTLNGLSKITKKSISTLKKVVTGNDTIFDLVKVVDNATIKEITEAQFKTIKLGRLKYGDALDFLKVFGEPTAFDNRLTGMVRSLKNIEDPEEIFERVLNMLDEDKVIDINILRNSAEFKDFVIGTAEGSGYIFKTASALNAVEDALNKNFKYMRRDILNALAGSKTNLEAFVKLDNYFKSQGMSLKEVFKSLGDMITDPTVDTAMYVSQKEFLENLMEELGISTSMLSDDSTAIDRAIAAVTGSEKVIIDANGKRKVIRIPYENVDEMLTNALKEIELYKMRGKSLATHTDTLFKIQKKFYSITRKKGKYATFFYKMLKDTTIKGSMRNALEQIIKAIESDSPINALLSIQKILKGTELEGTVLYKTLSSMNNAVQKQVNEAIAVLNILEPEYAIKSNAYKYDPEKVVLSDSFYKDYTPDGIYKRIKKLNFQIKALSNEDLEVANYLNKLIKQPNMIKTFENPIKPIELGKTLDLIAFKNSENFLDELKKLGVAKNLMENIPKEKIEEIINTLNKFETIEIVNEAGKKVSKETSSLFEEIRDELVRISSLDELTDTGFLEDSISNINSIQEKMWDVLDIYEKMKYKNGHLIIDSDSLIEYFDAINDLSESIESTVRSHSIKKGLREEIGSTVFRELEQIQTRLNEIYVPLVEQVMLHGEQGKVYRLKLLQFFNRIENIKKLKDTVYQGQSTLDILIDIAEGKQTIIGGLIEELATGNTTEAISNNFKDLAQKIQRKAQSTVNYLRLQEAIYSGHAGFGLNDAVMDWLENFNRKAPGEFVITKEELEQMLTERTELGKATNRMKLENYYNANVKHLYNDELRAHNAIDDRTMQVRILQYQYDKKYLTLNEGDIFVSFDLETTGLNIKQAELGDSDILQISAAKYQVQNGKIVQIDEGFEVYGKPRREPPKEIKDLVGADVITKCETEGLDLQDVTAQFIDYVGDLTVAGHNIIAFDIPYLKAVSNYKEGNVIDSLQIMRDTEFKSSLYTGRNADLFKEYVEDTYKIITEYAAKQTEIKMPFIYTVDKHLADDLYDLFNPLDSQLRTMDKRGLNALSHGRIEDARSYILGKADSSVDYSHKNLPEGTDTFDASRDGTSMIQTLRQGLTDTKNTNKELANWYITTDALEKAYGTTNIFAVMHGMQDGRYVDDFILNKFGVKTMWTPKHINILNNIPDNINAVGAVHLEKFRTSLDRNYERIYNNVYGYTKEQANQIREYILKDFSNSIYIQYTDLNTLSVYELWALYQTLTQYNIVNGVRVQTPNYEIVKGIMANSDVPKSIRDAVMYVDDVTKLNDSFDILADPQSSNKAIDDALANILANGTDNDVLRAIDTMEREYTAFIKDNGTFDEEWYSRMIRSEFETNYTVLKDARSLVDAKLKINPAVYYQYKRLNKQRFINYTKSVLGLNPTSLTKYMHEHGFISYLSGSDLTTFEEDIQRMLANKELYEQAGISFKQTDDKFIIYLNKNYETLYPDITKNVVYNTSYHGVPDKTQIDETMNNLMDALEKNDTRIKELDDGPFDAYNSSYNKVDGKKHRELIEELDLPDLVSQAYKEDFYGRVYQIDSPVLGTIEGVKRADPHAITDVVNAQVRELDRTLKLSGARQKYIQFLFNDDYTLKRNVLWNSMSDEQILSVLKGNKNLSVVVLYEKNGKVMARKISPTSVSHIQSIRNLNGSIFPTDMANKITGTINEYDKIIKENHPILYKWREYVVSTYKTLYLTSLGFLFRNGLDIITKNTATLEGGPANIPSVIKNNMRAFKMWDDYSKVIADILSGPDGHLTTDTINAYFEAHTELNREMFEFVHRYATSSASAGMAKAQQDLVKSFNLKKNSIQTNVYKKVLFENELVKGLMSVNAYIEHSGRLGLLLQSIEEGKIFDDAIQDVLRTHFDYSNLSYPELLAETFIPFVTFPIRNLEYWAGALKGNMWLVELMTDATMETNQLHNQTQFMIDNSASLQNNIASGNLRMLSTIIKTSPSAFDAARLFLTLPDVIANYSESDINKRVIAPLRVPRQEDIYGNVTDNDTKMKEYLRNVLAIYQVKRPFIVAGNVLGIKDGNVNNIADVLPSMFGEKEIKPGNNTGDMRMYQYLPNGNTLQTIIEAGFRQDANARQVITKVSAPKKRYTRAAYSKQRIPYVKRYYSSSANFYNRWKAQSYMRKNAMRNLPATPESLERTIRNTFFNSGLTPLKMNYIQYKLRNQYK